MYIILIYLLWEKTIKLKKFLLVLILSTKIVYADVYTFSTDNDLIFQTDKTYTAAIFFSWMGEEYSKADKDSFTYSYTSTLKDTFNYIPFISFKDKKLNATIDFQEMIITPEDINESEPVYDDIAYAGTVGVHFSLYSWDEYEFDLFRVSVGAVGPVSGAEYIQKYIHRLTNSTEPKGWDNQLDNHFALNFGYTKGLKSYTYNLNHNTRLEWFNSLFADVGNYYTGFGAGTLLRFGQNMPHNFDTLTALMSVTATNQINFKDRNNKFGWALSAGTYSNYVGYMYILEASKDAGYADVSQKAKLLTAKFGLDIYYEDLQVSLEVFPTEASYDVKGNNGWGRINITWAFD